MLHCLVDSLDSQPAASGPMMTHGHCSSALLADLQPVEELLEFDFLDMMARADQVEKSVQSIHTDRLDKLFYPDLIDRLDTFQVDMKDRLTRLCSLRAEVHTSVKAARTYFAENETKGVDEMLGSLNALRVDLLAVRVKKRTFSKNS